MTLFELLQNLGIFSALIAGLAWLARSLTKQVLDRDLEKFKSNLEKDAMTFKIKYERLHFERVEVIKEVYKKIVITYQSLHSLINPWQGAGEPSEEEKKEKASKNSIDLMKYYQENRIFFDEKLSKDIDTLIDIFRQAWNKFYLSRMAKEEGERKEYMQEWDSAWEQITEKVPHVKHLLEHKFRIILGIEDS